MTEEEIQGTAEDRTLARLPQLAEFRYELRRFLNFSETESDRLGVATQQYQLMQVIGALGEGESASISYLAERMVLRHNSTVELVDRAERARLVKRVTDERDLRRSLVELTPDGKAILERLISAHLSELEGDAGERLLRSLGELRRAKSSVPAEHTVEQTS